MCCIFCPVFDNSKFFILGKFLGNFLFHSSLAGTFIMSLSFICPFMYTNTSLGAIINGLGKTGFTFFINTASTLIRLFFVFYMIPRFGILGYLWGVLISQLFAFMVSILYINGRFHMFSFRKKIWLGTNVFEINFGKSILKNTLFTVFKSKKGVYHFHSILLDVPLRKLL